MKKGLPITLADGKERHLRFTVRDAKEVYALQEQQERRTPIEETLQILLIGLRHDDPSLTEDALLDLVDMADLPMLSRSVREAMGGTPEGVKDDVTIPLANSDPTSAK